ncbi:MAG: hypothetical protein Q8S57_12595 [Methanoregula sp.]|nr:hypothetical protein [Methanoregula sp.]
MVKDPLDPAKAHLRFEILVIPIAGRSIEPGLPRFIGPVPDEVLCWQSQYYTSRLS